jgi:WD40 repeat protein
VQTMAHSAVAAIPAMTASRRSPPNLFRLALFRPPNLAPLLHAVPVIRNRQIGPAMPHEGRVWNTILMKDSRRILSWSDDKTLRLWDVATGQQIGPATGG